MSRENCFFELPHLKKYLRII